MPVPALGSLGESCFPQVFIMHIGHHCDFVSYCGSIDATKLATSSSFSILPFSPFMISSTASAMTATDAAPSHLARYIYIYI